MHASTDPETGSPPAPRARKPWRTALAGLLLLGIAGGLMAYGAPSRAAVPSHSRPAHEASRTPPGYYYGWGSPSAGGFR